MTSSQASRRTLLAGFVAAAAGAPLLNAFTAAPAYAADSYLSNTKLYADPATWKAWTSPAASSATRCSTPTGRAPRVPG